jgi:hypothetical protein
MTRVKAAIAGVSAMIALSAGPTIARSAHAHGHGVCCRVPAGTEVEVELADPVSTKDQHAGDTFALRLAAPLIVNHRVVLRAGTLGGGEVIESDGPGLGGKSAKLVLAARFLDVRHHHIPLEGLQLAKAGRDNSAAAQVVGLGGIAFAPLGFVGLAVRGGQVSFPAGTSATAVLVKNEVLPSLGRASREAGQAAVVELEDVAGRVELPPPPPGEGQVVFFRRKSLLGSGQWFNVREDDKALGKLTNGAYFVQAAEPGVHTYTAKEEPEFKDHLKLEVAPGQTYFVEGTLTKGLVLSAADLTPSDRASFNDASRSFKQATRPAQETAEQPAPATSAAPPTP